MSLIIDPYRFAAAAAFDPSIITWHTAFWADDPSWSNPGDGNAVSSWRDFSGNSRTATQGTGGNQPIFRASTTNLNNRASVDFDGSNDFLVTASFTALSQPVSVVVVAEWKGGTGANDYLFNVGLPSDILAVLRRNSDGLWRANPGTTGLGTISATAAGHAISIVFNNTSTSFRVDNNSANTGGAGTRQAAQVHLGAFDSTPTEPGDYRIAFFGLYNGTVTSDGQWSTFKAALNTYYGTSLA